MNKIDSMHVSQKVLSFEALNSDQRYFDRILFLSCPTGAYCREDRCQSFFDADLVPTMRPPLEECEAGGAISASGSSFDVIDAPALNLGETQIFDRINRFNPDLIIVSVTFGSLEQDLLWCALLKEKYPAVPIGLRGAPCYVYPEKLLEQNSSLAFCMHGDYELILRSLIEYGLQDTAGITCRSESSGIINRGTVFAEDLDALPFPNRSRIDSQIYKVRGLGQPQATIRVQRGCPFPCTYCLVHTVSGKRARHRSPGSIVREMQSLIAAGIRFFYLRADTFTLDRKWTLQLLELIKKECPHAQWVTTTRVEHVDDEILAAMKAAGCYGLSFGLDVASEAISAQVKKPLRRKEAIEAMALCRKHGIISLAYVMIGFIWDNRQTLNEAADFIKSVCPDLLTIHYAHPYPGTVYYQQARNEQKSLSIVSLKAQAEPALEPDGLSARELKIFASKLLKKHYRRPKVIISLGLKLIRLVLITKIMRTGTSQEIRISAQHKKFSEQAI